MLNEHVSKIIDHLGFQNFIVNKELSDDALFILDNPISDRRVTLSWTDYTVRVSMFYSYEPKESALDSHSVNGLNESLGISKSFLSTDEEEPYIVMNSMYLLPYQKQTFNTFWSLFEADLDSYEELLSESVTD